MTEPAGSSWTATVTAPRRGGDRWFGLASHGAGVAVVALVTLVGVFLVSQAIPALSKNEANFLTSREWSVGGDNPRFGILEMLWTTTTASIIAMAIAVPIGVCVALFITEYAPQWLRRPAATLVDLLAAVPSIVYGLWGLIIFRPVVRPLEDWLSTRLGWLPLFAPTGITGGTIMFIGVVLAIMILPIVTAISREVFAQTPTTHKEGALALGATRWEMIRTAVLPFGKPGVISAAMLALGRALGETIAVTFIVSTLAAGSDWTWSMLSGGETFASRIANNAAEFDSPQKTGAFIAAGLVLFILTFVVNAIARVVIERRKAFTE
ncbi:MAG TPA: phosphate ABC transporter permease subunit PstC [Dermatophilaceae bacterium]|nr:phosphate ABC transporter permease subunit PstC [Dermatophilaceae bacterium]HOF37561.1 phosphate ABC transporter permease subunit PstC [Dermatophilaceae bacterium]HOR16699.1 phosphate ABC transporter permease subunit PstC [Dermatophilaceae bacterium]HOV02184.1 phosphate ABC transporter permease subunit PstC [Dermatophilaceae bacterium]HPK90609.1 phosphate ABC transporter permease subunit PstC [Dermatophilaceae bacterium]